MSPNTENTDQKKLRIWTIFTQCDKTNLQSCIVLDVERFHAITHVKLPVMSMLKYAHSFGKCRKEILNVFRNRMVFIALIERTGFHYQKIGEFGRFTQYCSDSN